MKNTIAKFGAVGAAALLAVSLSACSSNEPVAEETEDVAVENAEGDVVGVEEDTVDEYEDGEVEETEEVEED